MLQLVAGGVRSRILSLCSLLSLIALGFGHAFALFEIGLGILLNLIFVGICFLLDFGGQTVLTNDDLFLRENLLTLGLFDFGLDGLDVDGLLLFLLLNGIGRIGISLCGVGLFFQVGPFQGEVVVLHCDSCVGIHPRIVGILVGVCHLYFHIALGIGSVDGCILFNLCRIVGTEVVDKSFLIGHVLDVARDDFYSQFGHIRLGFLHHLVGKTVAVGVERPQVERTDDFAHITLQ